MERGNLGSLRYDLNCPMDNIFRGGAKQPQQQQPQLTSDLLAGAAQKLTIQQQQQQVAPEGALSRFFGPPATAAAAAAGAPLSVGGLGPAAGDPQARAKVRGSQGVTTHNRGGRDLACLREPIGRRILS